MVSRTWLVAVLWSAAAACASEGGGADGGLAEDTAHSVGADSDSQGDGGDAGGDADSTEPDSGLEAEDTAEDADSGAGPDGLAFEDGGETSVPCAERSFADCELEPGCILVKGTPKDAWCTDPEGPMEPLACTSGPVACDVSGPVCATHSDGSGDYILGGAFCGVDGWVSCEPACDAPNCGPLLAADCQSQPKCVTQMGWNVQDYCAGELLTKVFVGCEPLDPERACGEAESCGESAQGVRLVFPTTCLPAGFSPCPTEVCEPPACEGNNEAECWNTPGCVALTGYEEEAWCSNGGGAEAPEPTFYAGCVQSSEDLVCPATVKCARQPGTDKRVFFSSCVPPDWLPCPDDPCDEGSCVELSEAPCKSKEGCAWFVGYTTEMMCDGPGDISVEGIACGPEPLGCGDALTCGVSLASAEVVEFPDTCLPPGWQPCQGDICTMGQCTTSGGSPAPSHTFCVRGEMQPNGTELFKVGAPVKVQMAPAGGCWSSSCTEWPVLQCALSEVEPNVFEVAGVSCAKPTGEDACTPDCGGAFAVCLGSAKFVQGANYIVGASESVAVQVPSEAPAGGICFSVDSP